MTTTSWRMARALTAVLLALLATSRLAAQAPSISATPNPVPPASGKGTTTISWDSGSDDGVVRVSVNGAPEQEFARGRSGSARAEWIEAQGRFEFRLYASPTSTNALARVLVRMESRAFIRATPNPIPAGPDQQPVLIEWSTGDDQPGVVEVLTDNANPQAFASGASGSNRADWIDSQRTYEFRLFAEGPPRQFLASVIVTRVPPFSRDATALKFVVAGVIVLLIAGLWRFLKTKDAESLP